MRCLYVFFLLLPLFLILASACGNSVTTEEIENYDYDRVVDIASQESSHYAEEIAIYKYSTGYFIASFELTLDYAINKANERRNNFNELDLDRLWNLIQGQEPWSLDLARFANGNRVSSISRDEAVYDANALFQLLRHFYGGYNYFGGDEVFLPLFEDILKAIDEQEQWNTGLFIQLLRDYLSTVIADNHFFIESHDLGVSYNVFIWDTPFEKSENGFRKQDTSLYVTDIVDHDMQEIFRLSVDEEGNFFYYIIIMNPENEGIIYNFDAVWSTGEIETISLRRTLISPSIGSGAEPSLRYENDIPIVTFRSKMGHPFHYHSYEDEYARIFLSLTEYLQGESVIIIDIRGNPGGYTSLTRIWLNMLLGEIVPSNFVLLESLWRGAMTQIPENWYWFFEPIDKDNLAILDSIHATEYLGNYHVFSSFPNQTIANDILIILLVDRHTFSSGEIFTDQMLNIENTIILGQNTAGALLTSSSHPLFLPNSGIRFFMGSIHFAFHDNEWKEGIGIAPDIWVIGDALTAALAIIE